MNDSKDYKKLYNDKVKEIETYKNKISNYYNTCKDKDESIKKLQIEIKNINTISEEKDKSIKELEFKISELNNASILYNKMVSNNQALKKQINKQQLKIDNLKEENNKMSVFDTKGELEKSNEREKQLLIEIEGLKNKNNKLKDALDQSLRWKDIWINSRKASKTIASAIHTLNYDLSLNNVDSYKIIIDMARRVQKLMDMKKDYSKKCNFNAQKEQIGGIRTLFGYIFEDNDEIKFINTDGVKYDISMLENNFQIDVPVKATLLNETTVKIDKIYGGYAQDICDDVNKVKKSDNDKSEKEILSELKEEIVQIGNYKVMVISGRKSKYYKQYLNLYGLNVTTFNPFEENLNLLNEKVKSQDIIIIMKHTISHDVMKIINLEDKKVQVIGRDNIKYLVARIRYYLANKDEDITKVNY